MKDPVTALTGITYDRESIERWLATAEVGVCPVTKQPLSPASDLTPNHMLRRLIQAWCIANSRAGIDPPKSPVNKSIILKLIRDVSNRNDEVMNISGLKKLDELVNRSSEEDLKSMAEARVGRAMVSFICRRFQDGKIVAVDLAVRILRMTWMSPEEMKMIVGGNTEFLKSILWILNSRIENHVKIQALIILKNVTEVADSSLLDRMEPDLLTGMVRCLRKNCTSPAAARSILQILIKTCRSARNRARIVDAGAVFELIEMELGKPERKTTELIFCLLAILCSCADGRQKLLKHAGGIAVAAKRLLRVSPSTDDRILCMLESIARSSATREVVAEILRVGGVTKLCMVLQADCAGYLKSKAREILRLHSGAWNNSPCIQVYLMTRDPR